MGGTPLPRFHDWCKAKPQASMWFSPNEGSGVSQTVVLLSCAGGAEFRSCAPLGEWGDRLPELVAPVDACMEIIPVHYGDHFQFDLLGADTGALADIGATAEAFGVHLRHHGE